MENCKECGRPVDIKAGEEIHPSIGRLAPDYGKVELCRACFSVGWETDPEKVFNSIANDEELSKIVQFKSPLTPTNKKDE